jgi:hypothetical protein
VGDATLAALDCGSEEGEVANNIEHAQARRGTRLAGMNFECARTGAASANGGPGTRGLAGRLVTLAVFWG